MALRFIPPGEFNMGSEQGGPDEKPVHRVTLTQGYYLGVLEVTQEQYQTIMQQIPRSWSNRKADPADGRRYPIDNVEWHVAMDFCRRLSESPEEARHQRKYRLPTEAEWEFACRAGTNTRWVFGDDPSQLPEHEWHSVHGRTVHFVGTKTANPWGIYDMPGNVWEWCVDFYGSYSQNPVTNPRGPESSAHRVVRGGCWWVGWNDCRNTKRHSSAMPHHRRRLIGFRVVLDVPDN